jgi:hypothetical protein
VGVLNHLVYAGTQMHFEFQHFFAASLPCDHYIEAFTGYLRSRWCLRARNNCWLIDRLSRLRRLEGRWDISGSSLNCILCIDRLLNLESCWNVSWSSLYDSILRCIVKNIWGLSHTTTVISIDCESVGAAISKEICYIISLSMSLVKLGQPSIYGVSFIPKNHVVMPKGGLSPS